MGVVVVMAGTAPDIVSVLFVAELSSRRGLSVYSTHPSRMAKLRGSVFSSLVLFVLKRVLYHDATGVALVRSELSRDLVGLP